MVDYQRLCNLPSRQYIQPSVPLSFLIRVKIFSFRENLKMNGSGIYSFIREILLIK